MSNLDNLEQTIRFGQSKLIIEKTIAQLGCIATAESAANSPYFSDIQKHCEILIGLLRDKLTEQRQTLEE